MLVRKGKIFKHHYHILTLRELTIKYHIAINYKYLGRIETTTTKLKYALFFGSQFYCFIYMLIQYYFTAKDNSIWMPCNKRLWAKQFLFYIHSKILALFIAIEFFFFIKINAHIFSCKMFALLSSACIKLFKH